jgi:hypothetical protein
MPSTIFRPEIAGYQKGLYDQWRDLCYVITTTSDENYRYVPTLKGSSIGDHTRHVIECYQQLVEGLPSRVINYEARQRNPVLATERVTALELLPQIMHRLQAMVDRYEPDYALDKIETPALGMPQVTARTSLGAEILCCNGHATHHLALIAERGLVMNIPFRPGLGRAIATIQHERRADLAS